MYTPSPHVIGSHPRYIPLPLTRFVLNPGIYPLPSCDWSPLLQEGNLLGPTLSTVQSSVAKNTRRQLSILMNPPGAEMSSAPPPKALKLCGDPAEMLRQARENLRASLEDTAAQVS